MVWLVSHLKATWPPNANFAQPPQWCVSRGRLGGSQRRPGHLSALERLGARKLYRLRYIPRWIPIGVCRGSPLWPLTWANAESGAVADLLGHSSIAITGDVYGHTSDDRARAAVDGLAGRLGL